MFVFLVATQASIVPASFFIPQLFSLRFASILVFSPFLFFFSFLVTLGNCNSPPLLVLSCFFMLPIVSVSHMERLLGKVF